MKRCALLIMIGLFVALPACSKKPPEPTAVRGRNILAVLRDLSSTYTQKNLTQFMAGVSPSYPDRDALSRSLASVFAKYETIRFNIQFTKMIIMVDDKARTRATFTWDGEWILPGGTAHRDGARVTLVFDAGSDQLMSIDGKNPFIPQPGEMPSHQ